MTFAINILETLVVISSQRHSLGLGLGAGLGLGPSKRERESIVLLLLCSFVPEATNHTQNKIALAVIDTKGGH